jgi:hypothetical protein
MSLDADLLEELGTYAYDPLGFVMWAFPWGEPGELSKEDGPDSWQTLILELVRDNLISAEQALQVAVTSGHGVGKSALVSWLTLWAFCTFPGTRGVVTANTENQLKTKTWVEIAKWFRLFIANHLFKCTATALFSADESMAREWRIDIVPWSENNTEAFAGLHNAGKRLIILFDEASKIPDTIWETTEGALTDEATEIMWFAFGNPTRNQGRFRDCFPGGKFSHRWVTKEVDSRDVKRTNKKQLNEWIEDRGLDSDFVRVRILGKFPRNDENSFISLELAREASVRHLYPAEGPVVLGVDVARFGDDTSVIYARQGHDARSRRPEVISSSLNLIQLAARVAETYRKYEAETIFVDEGGVGGGLVDILENMGLPVVGIQFGSRPDGINSHDPLTKYANKRAEMYGALKHWLRIGCIPDAVPGADIGLVDQLAAPTYDYQLKTEAIVLEPKKAIKQRLGFSPDIPDGLALTFAWPIFEQTSRRTVPAVTDYNPFEEARLL